MSADTYVFEVTDRLRRVIEVVRGPESAAVWLDSLPSVVEEYAMRWNLTLTGIPDSGAMSCCVFARLPDGQDVVLKIPFDQTTGLQESALLDRWSRRGGAPRVHQVDNGTGVFLMSRVVPGTIVEPGSTEDATRAVVALMDRVHSADFGGLPTLPPVSQIALMRIDWADERFETTGNSAGAELARAARDLTDELIAVTSQNVLLHGDLQPKNILTSNTTGLQVIDPLACIGPAVTDAALWAAVQDSAISIDERITQLSQLGDFDRESLQSWATVFAVAELRPYSMKYSARMVAYLKSGYSSPRLLPESGQPITSLVDAALMVTNGI